MRPGENQPYRIPPPLNEGGDLESAQQPAPQVIRQAPVEEAVAPAGPKSLLHLNRWAILATSGILSVIVVVGVITLWSAGFKANNQSKQPASNYDTKDLTLSNLNSDVILNVTQATKLNINGELQVGNTFVLTPTATPSTPKTGQIYYNKDTNTPFIYNGSTFVSLLDGPRLESLNGITGALTLGNGLQLNGSQIGLSAAAQQSIGVRVTTIQGQSGDIILTGGSGISVNGTTISNTGVTQVLGSNGLVVAQSGGLATISLPQLLGNTDLPTFSNVQLNNALTISSGGTNTNGSAFTSNGVFYFNGTSFATTPSPAGDGLCLQSGPSGPVFASCSGGSSVTSLNGANGTLILDNATANVSTGHVTIDDATTAAKGIASFSATDFSVASGAVSLQNTITKAGNSFNGSAQLLKLDSGGQATGTGQCLLSTAGGVAFTTCPGGGNISSGTAQTPGKLVKFDSTTNKITDSIASESGTTLTVTGILAATFLQGDGSAITTLDASKVTSGTLSVANGGTGQVSFTVNGLLLGNGTSGLGTVAPGVDGQCLVMSSGTPVFTTCTGAGGVSKLNNATGNLTLSNASAVGTIITIDTADTAGTKGIASFNSTNFSVSGGVVNTVQNIHNTAGVQFASAVLTGTTALTLGQASTNTGVISFHNNTNGFSTTLRSGVPLGNLTFTLPSADGTSGQCLTTNASGVLSFADCLSGSGPSGGVSSLQGTANRVTVNASTGAVTITTPQDIHTAANVTFNTAVLTGASSLTLGQGSANTGSVAFKNSTNNFSTTLQSGTPGANLTFTLPSSDGTSGQCLTTNASGVLSFSNCLSGGSGGSGGVTSLQGATSGSAISGALSISNSTSSGSTITLDTATTGTKGIASFSGADFSVAGGAVSLQNTVTKLGNTFNGINQLVLLDGSGFLPALNGSQLTSLNASNITSGTLAVAQGGTGAGSFTTNGVLYGNGTSIASTAVGTTGQCLVATTGAAPSFQTCTGAGGVSQLNSMTGAITIQNGTGLSLTPAAGTITLANTGVLSLTGTANRVSVSSGTGAITLSLPQDIHTAADVQFASAALTGATALTLGQQSANTGAIAFKNATNNFTTLLQSGAPLANLAFTLPSADGTSGQCLKTNSSGVLSFGDCLAGTTGGSGGVVSLQGGTGGSAISGAVSINNATSGGTAITIDDASATAKGIAQFSNADFSVAAGVVSLGTVSVAKGGTGLTSYTTGDLLYASNSTTIAKLAAVASGSCLISNGVGAAPQWGSCGSGISGIGTYSTTNADAKGASIVSNQIIFQSASALAPGMVDTGAQTFAGNKTFNGTVTAATLQAPTSTALTLTGNAASMLSTSSGNLTLQAGSGTVSLGTSTVLGSTNGLGITAGAALLLRSTTASAITLDSGTTGDVNVGTGANAKTVAIGNSTGATAVNITAGTGGFGVTSQTSTFTSSATTQTGLQVNANSLTTGNGMKVSTTSGNITGGNLLEVAQSSVYGSIFTSSSKLLNVSRNITGVPTLGVIGIDPVSKTSTQGSTGAASLTLNHTVGTNSNRALVVNVEATNVTSVTFTSGSVLSLTKIAEVAANPGVSQWILLNPPSGAGTITVNSSNATNGIISIIATSLSNVDQTTPYGTSATASWTANSPATMSVAASTVSGQMVIDSFAMTNGFASPTPGGSQILAGQNSGGLYTHDASYQTASGTTTTMSWTYIANRTAGLVATPFNPAPVPGTTNGTLTGSVASIASTCAGCTESGSILNLQQANTSATGAVLSLQNSGLGADIQLGSGILRNASNSTAALSIQNSAGTETLFKADTTNNRVVIGNATGTGANTTVLVLDAGTAATPPTGVAGAMYYDTTNNVFKCYTTSWVSCSQGAPIATSSGTTAGVIAKFDGSGNIMDSSLAESGTTNKTLTYSGNLVVNTASGFVGSVLTANAATGFSGNLLDLKLNNTSKLTVNELGNVTGGTYNGLTVSGTTITGTGGLTIAAGGTGNQTLTLQGTGTGGIALSGAATVAGNLSLSTGSKYQINSVQISSADLSNDGNLAKLAADQAFTGLNSFNSAATIQHAVSISADSATTGGALQISSTSALMLSGNFIDVSQASQYANNYSTTNTLLNVARTVGTQDITATISQIGSVSSGFSTNSANSGQTYFTFSHTVPSGSNKVLFVALATCFDTMTITYGAQSLTKYPTTGTNTTGSSCNGSDAGGYGRVSYYYLINPAVGTNTITVTTGSTAAQYAGAIAMTFQNVNQTTPINNAAAGNPATINVRSYEVGLDVYLGTAGGSYNPVPGGSQTLEGSVIGGGPFRMGASKTPVSGTTISQMSWTPVNSSIWDHLAIRLNPAVIPGVGSASGNLVNFTNSCNAGTCGDTTTLLNLNQTVIQSTGSVLKIQNAGTGYGLEVGGNSSLFSGAASGYNTLNAATIYVGKDATTNRSINAAGSVNTTGSDYAEWIPWSGAKPEPGSVITYKGSTFIVSSQETAGIVGNDGSDTANSILVAFAGQLPVRVTGAVHEGDLLVSNGDGTARAVPQSQASFADYSAKVGIAWESSDNAGVKKIKAAVGTSASAIPGASALQGTGSFSSLNVSGNVAIGGNLTVAGLATVHNLAVSGHIITTGGQPTYVSQAATGTGASVSVDGTDTLGTITIITGSAPTAGEMARVVFSEVYGKAPRVVLSASNDNAAGMRFYKGATSTDGFMLNFKDAPTANTTYTFDYFIGE